MKGLGELNEFALYNLYSASSFSSLSKSIYGTPIGFCKSEDCRKTVDFSGIRSRIVGEDEHTDHMTTTTTQC